MVYSASRICFHRVLIGSSCFSITFTMSIDVLNPKSLSPQNWIIRQIVFDPIHFHPKIGFFPKMLSSLRSCTIPKISLIDHHSPHSSPQDVVNRAVISMVDTTFERALKNHHGNIVF